MSSLDVFHFDFGHHCGVFRSIGILAGDAVSGMNDGHRPAHSHSHKGARSFAHLAGVQLVSIDVSASVPVTGWAGVT